MYTINVCQDMLAGKSRSRFITLLVSVTVLLLCLCGVFFIVMQVPESRIDQIEQDIKDDRIKIEHSIREKGGKQTYEQIKKEAEGLSVFDRHGVGHRFGEILYSVEGVRGIEICDGELSFGCFHSFTIAAIYDKGIEVVKDIDSICIERYGLLGHGCTHGIGHGLIEYFGATEEGLGQSLEVCRDLAYKGTIMGCKNGVFMEFNHPSPKADGELRSSREFDESNPYYPCNVVKVEYQPACFYEQGKWVHRVSGSLNKGLDYCNKIRSEQHRKICLMGVGANAGEEANFDSKKAFQSCTHVEGEAMEFCAAGAEFIIKATNPSLSKDALPCTLLQSNSIDCQNNTEKIVD